MTLIRSIRSKNYHLPSENILNKRENYENGILTVRFTGENLSLHGVSIYDLGESLLALQRIVHKAYLAKEGRLYKGSYPNKEEREKLALQLGERRRSSDAFALVPLLADPNIQDFMKKLCDYILSGIVGYYTGDLLDRVKNEKDENKRIFIGAIYGEVVNIVNRVDTIGGVEGISIGAPALGRETVAAFSSETKKYLAEIKDETYLGSYQEINGSVYKFYPASRIIGIRRAGGNTITVFLNEKDFEEIRYKKETNPMYRFKGHPVYKFGIETKSVSEFQADEIEYIVKEES